MQPHSSVPSSLRTFFTNSSPHWHGSCAHRPMPIRPCHKPSNSCQNRSKRRRFPSKRDQKRAHFVMPILTFWGVTPSGASARAVLGVRRGQKGCFSSAQNAPKKLSTVQRENGGVENRNSQFKIRNPQGVYTPGRAIRSRLTAAGDLAGSPAAFGRRWRCVPASSSRGRGW